MDHIFCFKQPYQIRGKNQKETLKKCLLIFLTFKFFFQILTLWFPNGQIDTRSWHACIDRTNNWFIDLFNSIRFNFFILFDHNLIQKFYIVYLPHQIIVNNGLLVLDVACPSNYYACEKEEKEISLCLNKKLHPLLLLFLKIVIILIN